MNCGVSIWNMVLKYWMMIMNLANTISGLCNKIPQQAVENVLHNLVFVLIVAIAILIPLGLLGYGVYKLVRYYCDYLWDKITLAVVLISIAVVANFADAIKVLVTVNSVVLLSGIQMLYVVVRITIEVVSVGLTFNISRCKIFEILCFVHLQYIEKFKILLKHE